jgi:Trypsin-co-occurring domain 1
MERELVQFEAAGGQVVVVEQVEPAGPEAAPIERVSRVGDVLVSKIPLDDALGVVRTTAHAVVTQLRDFPRAPDKVEVEFGLQLSSKVGAVIAAGEAQAHLKLKLTWQPAPTPPPPRAL